MGCQQKSRPFMLKGREVLSGAVPVPHPLRFLQELLEGGKKGRGVYSVHGAMVCSQSDRDHRSNAEGTMVNRRAFFHRTDRQDTDLRRIQDCGKSTYGRGTEI